MSYRNETNDTNYPKTLMIRNHEGGGVWQIYHVEAEHEAKQISGNANRNGFQEITLEDHQPGLKQTWPDWRETPGGKVIIEEHE